MSDTKKIQEVALHLLSRIKFKRGNASFAYQTIKKYLDEEKYFNATIFTCISYSEGYDESLCFEPTRENRNAVVDLITFLWIQLSGSDRRVIKSEYTFKL